MASTGTLHMHHQCRRTDYGIITEDAKHCFRRHHCPKRSAPNLANSMVLSPKKERVPRRQVIYQDLPSNLGAVWIESLANRSSSAPIYSPEPCDGDSLLVSEQASSSYRCSESSELGNAGGAVNREEFAESNTHKKYLKDPGLELAKGRPRAVELMNDFRILEKEIRDFIVAHGTEGVMPLREHLRQYWRSDLEKAISVMGGFRTVAARMKLSLAYEETKPPGYWGDVQNLRNEVIAVQREIGGDPAVLPSRDSIRLLGCYSLARALEKWGGFEETAKILGLKTSRLQKQEQRSKKISAIEFEGSAFAEKPSLIDNASPLDLKECFSSKLYKGAVLSASSTMQDASQQPSRTHEGFSESSCQEPPQDVSAKDRSHSSKRNKESPHFFLKHSFSSSSNRVKDKMIPYKMDVPQGSSKWLPLFVDAAQTEFKEEFYRP